MGDLGASRGVQSTAPTQRPVRSGREIISIQVGKAGNAIGHEFWRDLCEEHQLDISNEALYGTCTAEDDVYTDNLDVFFNETTKGAKASKSSRWVPRCILVDLNMQDLACVTQDSVGDLYHPENIVGNDEGSGNCYAKAFHTEGPALADRTLELVRKEVERCNCLQGIQFTHSVSGGAGSGLTGLLMKTLTDYLDKGSKCIMQNFTLVPSPRISDVIIEHYNASLGLQDLLDYSHQVFLFDNQALMDVCHKTMDLEAPKMQKLNNIVALCMSAVTSSLRFTGPLNSDLGKLQANLVPFKNAHFLITGIAPLTNQQKKKYRALTPFESMQNAMSKDHVTLSCDPVNPGDRHHDPPIMPSRFLASWASWRGKYQTYEVEEVLRSLQKEGSRFEKFFPDWIPNAVASSIVKVPHCDVGDCLGLTSNNTAVHTVFQRIIQSWDKLFQKKSYLHLYESEGIAASDMQESRNNLSYVLEQYLDYAGWDDKFFEDQPVMGKLVAKESAVDNDEQRTITHELAELGDGEMWIGSR